MSILDLSTYKTLTGTTSAVNDDLITALLPAVQSQMETYCDRLFDAQDYAEWYHYDGTLILKQYPVNLTRFIGQLVIMANFAPTTGYMYETTTTGITITDEATFTDNSFAFADYTTLAQLKIAIETAIPAVTMSIVDGYSAYNYRLIRVGSGSVLYGATKADLNSYVDDNRTLTFLSDYSFIFWNCMDLGYPEEMLVIYNAGYTSATMPMDLKIVEANCIRDMINVLSNTPSDGIVGVYASENLKNYSYTLASGLTTGTINVAQVVSKYHSELYAYRKKCI